MRRSVVVAAAATVALASVTGWTGVAAGQEQHSFAAAAPGMPGGSKLFQPETPDNALFARLKAAANQAPRQAGADVTGATASPKPFVFLSASGTNDPGWYPPHWNSAPGPGRYIQVVNNRVGFTTLSAKAVSSDTTFHLAGTSDPYVGDPEISYDPATKKFYYAMLDRDASGNWYIAYGFSKLQKPSSVADFCHYRQAYGTAEPANPRLGGTKDFLLIGVNVYAGDGSYTDSRVQWARKPPASSLTACPTDLATGVQSGEPFAPVPAQQTDPSSTGYVLASVWSGGSTITRQKVQKSASGTPVFSGFSSYSVKPYSMPADVPQPGTSDLLSTMDNRLFQVIQSYDPRVGAAVLWTSLTTFAGAGSGTEWFEFKASGGMVQQGVVSRTTVYVFNGTVSPDRAYVSSTQKNYGSSMGLAVNTGSATQYAGMSVAGKRGTLGISPLDSVGIGNLPITCGGTCWWGDRSSAHPMLTAPQTSTTGQILVTSGVAGGNYYALDVELSP